MHSIHTDSSFPTAQLNFQSKLVISLRSLTFIDINKLNSQTHKKPKAIKTKIQITSPDNNRATHIFIVIRLRYVLTDLRQYVSLCSTRIRDALEQRIDRLITIGCNNVFDY